MEWRVQLTNVRARFRNEAHRLASEGEGAYLPFGESFTTCL